MAFPMHSQTTLTTPRVTTVVNSKGDTLIQMNLADAKTILADVLDKKIVDSLLIGYIEKDKISAETIILQKSEIVKLQQTSVNKDVMLSNLEHIIANNAIEVKDLNDIIKKQKKEIRKQKFLKIIGFTAAVALPVATIILLTK